MGYKPAIKALAVSGDNTIITTMEDGVLMVWKIDMGMQEKLLMSFNPHGDPTESPNQVIKVIGLESYQNTSQPGQVGSFITVGKDTYVRHWLILKGVEKAPITMRKIILVI